MSLSPYVNSVFNGENFLLFTKSITIASIGIATGAGLSYNAMIMPSLAKFAPSSSLAVFCETAFPAMSIQVSAIAVSVLGGSYIYYMTKNRFFLYSSLIMASILPYTAAFFLPINARLFEMNKTGRDDGTIGKKMAQWNRNQYGRVGLNALALFVSLFGVLHVKSA
ncbi:hypothetical protein BGZ96_011146 [Linnemannia gamsii]|uniref:DUF1772-domain-containing protein n=1 Tax=Linnemannia gamsii TaxID=64522 RepID=A0ABQ7JT64_9FUNG|nr:hypothetical protein BGZ96_011146 [Linnemannia gamsii]